MFYGKLIDINTKEVTSVQSSPTEFYYSENFVKCSEEEYNTFILKKAEKEKCYKLALSHDYKLVEENQKFEINLLDLPQEEDDEE